MLFEDLRYQFRNVNIQVTADRLRRESNASLCSSLISYSDSSAEVLISEHDVITPSICRSLIHIAEP